MTLGALRSALSAKLRDGELKVVQAFYLPGQQDQSGAGSARQAGARKTVLLVESDENRNFDARRPEPGRRDVGGRP